MKSLRPAPCVACSHRWARHDAGIGRCREGSCPCVSFMDDAAADWRAYLARVLGLDAASALQSLGLPETATSDEIKTAFRKRALELHPDHGGDPEKFKELVRIRDQALGKGGP